MCCKHRFWVLWLSCRASCFVILFICGQLPCVMFLGPQSRSTKTYFILLRMHCFVDRGWQVFFFRVCCCATCTCPSDTNFWNKTRYRTRQTDSAKFANSHAYAVCIRFHFQFPSQTIRFLKEIILISKQFVGINSNRRQTFTETGKQAVSRFWGFDTRLIKFIYFLSGITNFFRQNTWLPTSLTETKSIRIQDKYFNTEKSGLRRERFLTQINLFTLVGARRI